MIMLYTIKGLAIINELIPLEALQVNLNFH
jgi:hypothetical protein